MMSDIPLPIPLSVIFSPSHITNIVPVTRTSTDIIVNMTDASLFANTNPKVPSAI